jgi:predicted regulator of Ras-like GTPase activity (Roadblock/LC7/MglB family)
MADIENGVPQKKILRNGVNIYPAQEAALDQLIGDLDKRISPAFILVADTAGQSILSRGDLDKAKLTALGSLVAGDLAASQEMARIIGQYGTYQMILREGKESNFFISEIGNELLLLCHVPNRTPLGWARLLIRETAKQMAEILKTPGDEISKMDFGLKDQKLEDLFGDSLSNIWNN